MKILDNPKLRKLFILVHLYLAAFMAPAFFLLGYTGMEYLRGNIDRPQPAPVSLAAGSTLDANSATLVDDVEALLKTAGINYRPKAVVPPRRGSGLVTQPELRTHYTFAIADDGAVKANVIKPSLAFTMMEIHKGHGSALLKTYHKLVGIALIIVVFGGILVGLMAKAYRRKSIVATVLGFVVYLGLIYF